MSSTFEPFGLHQVEPLSPVAGAPTKAEKPGRRLVSGRRLWDGFGTSEEPLKCRVFFLKTGDTGVPFESQFDLSNFG